MDLGGTCRVACGRTYSVLQGRKGTGVKGTFRVGQRSVHPITLRITFRSLGIDNGLAIRGSVSRIGPFAFMNANLIIGKCITNTLPASCATRVRICVSKGLRRAATLPRRLGRQGYRLFFYCSYPINGRTIAFG